jgi:CBS domain-containing protein
MQPLNFAVPPELRVFAAIHRYFLPLRLPALVVATEGQMVGVLTAEAARRLPEPVWTHLPVGTVMQPLTSPDMVLPVTADLGQALDRMLGDEQQCLLVVDEQGALAGVLTPELLAQAAQVYGRA